jgi:superfamily II DNA or RNA helicase
MDVCGFREGFSLRDEQKPVVEEALREFEEANRQNVFISLPQGTGKTIIALAVLSKLRNYGKVRHVLVLIPGRQLVKQWMDKANMMFYGLGLIEYAKLSKEDIHKIRGFWKYSGAVGVAMTVQSFKNVIKKEAFTEEDFDMVIIDEAADLVVSRDFIEGFRMSKYLKGMEKWQNKKIFLLPYHVAEKKIIGLMKKFGKNSKLIRKMVKPPTCTVQDPYVINDPLINVFVETLQENYKKIKTSVHRLLNKYGVEGYRENLETLLNPDTLERLKMIYHLDEDALQQIQISIVKYILIQHIEKWFLYSNRAELSRSILSAQRDVKVWLNNEDKKLSKLVEIVKNCLNENKKVYIFSQYLATAEYITDFLTRSLSLKPRDIVLITGLDDADAQFKKLSSFKDVGKILVTTPVFGKGTDIPEADVIIVYTPPLNTEKLFQVVGRIRGGEVIFLAYKGYEEEIMNLVAEQLRRALASEESETPGLDRYL